MDSTVVFEARGLGKEYDAGQVHALRGVDMTIREGEFIAIVGPSGCGKSTLLRMLGALDRPTAGRLLYRGASIPELSDPSVYRAREVGFVFQDFHLLPTFTAIENVQLPMLGMGMPTARRRDRAKELLEAVGLKHRLDHLPTKLSGGERQRVAIARSLANEPAVLLADEPTGNLDSENAEMVMHLLDRIHRERAGVLVLVTHDPAVAAHASRQIEMKDGRVSPCYQSI
jgi:putative ABC transport system ATP-binding protein